MGANTKIEWADHTFNPWRGCRKVSPACANCYAEKQAKRNPNTLGVWGDNGTRVVAAEAAWREPMKWDREAKAAGVRRRVFCASMADVFEDWTGPISSHDGRWLVRPYLDSESGPENWQLGYPEDFKVDPQGWKLLTMADVRRRLFELIDATPHLDWLLLTKRPENIAAMMPPARGEPFYEREGPYEIKHDGMIYIRPNVWIGATVENQQAADERIPHLLRVPAKVRFLSCEPLLGPINLIPHRNANGAVVISQGINADWVIAGGESGPNARPSHPDWFRSLRDQCTEVGVPYFHKQNGEWWASGERDGQQVFRQFTSQQQWVNKASTWMSPGEICLDADGKRCERGADFESAQYPVIIMRRVGKAAAGRLLDGKEWNEVPEVQA